MNKNIIIWRHTEAELASESIVDDDRQLTEKGVNDAENMARWLAKHLPEDAKIYCSPAARCKQTLDTLLAKKTKKKSFVAEYHAALGLQSSVEKIRQQLLQKGAQNLVLVGHQPLLGELIAFLLHGKDAKIAPYAVKKGAVWWLRYPQTSAPHANAGCLLTSGGLMNAEIFVVKHPKNLR